MMAMRGGQTHKPEFQAAVFDFGNIIVELFYISSAEENFCGN